MSDELCPQRALLDDGPGPCLRLVLDVQPPRCIWCGRVLGPDALTVASLITDEERARVMQWLRFEQRAAELRPATTAAVAGADLSDRGGGVVRAIHLQEVPGSRRTWSGGGSFTLAPVGSVVGGEACWSGGTRLARLMRRQPTGVEEPDDFSTGGPCRDGDTLTLDELRIEIGLWLADRTKDHETIRALGRLLGVDMGGE